VCAVHRLRRFALALTVAVLATLVVSASGHAYGGIYAGPKTFLQGWWADSSYDTHWFYDEMDPSCVCLARVAFIDPSGTWHESISWASRRVYTWADREYGIPEKPFCKNNSSVVYTAYCVVTT
jgi:hypothetical protein